MKSHVTGKAAVAAAAPTPQTEAAQVSGLRTRILDLLFDSPVITAKEWATAVERTSNTQNVATLAKWYYNTVAEIGRREAAAVVYATGEQKEQIIRLLNHPRVSRPVKTRVLLHLNRMLAVDAVRLLADLTTITSGPASRPALSRADRRAAARFRPTRTLTSADLYALATATATREPKAGPHLSLWTCDAQQADAALRPAKAGDFVCFVTFNN